MKFISPSALSVWLTNQEEYYLKYICTNKVPRIPQNQAMSVGSSFDAYIKAYLSARLFGKEEQAKLGLGFDTLFEKQVEPHNRDFAIKAGAVCFTAYKDSGALTRLFELLQSAKEPPKFEFTECGQVDDVGGIYNSVKLTDSVREQLSQPQAGDVVLLGKPDLFFITKSDINVVLDWKVNGYCSTGQGKRPTPGYMCLLDGYEPKSKNHGTIHRDVVPYEESCGLHYSLNPNIELNERDWARQISVYSWLCGAPVGSNIVVAIDQLCCKPSFPAPNITVAQHRCTITEKFQIETYRLFQQLWDIIHSDHYFRDLSLEESQKRCQILQKQATIYQGEDENTDFLRRMRTNK